MNSGKYLNPDSNTFVMHLKEKEEVSEGMLTQTMDMIYVR